MAESGKRRAALGRQHIQLDAFRYSGAMEGFTREFNLTQGYRFQAFGFDGNPLSGAMRAADFCTWAILTQLPFLAPQDRRTMLLAFHAAGLDIPLGDASASVVRIATERGGAG